MPQNVETGELNIRRVRSVCGGYNKGEENIYSNVLSVGLAEPCYNINSTNNNNSMISYNRIIECVIRIHSIILFIDYPYRVVT